MQKHNILRTLKVTVCNKVDHTCKRLATVNGIEQQPLETREQKHGIVHGLRRNPVAIADVIAVRNNVGT